MTVKRSGLGRNLSALLGNVDNVSHTTEKPAETAHSALPINVLQPGKYQPRSDIEDESLAELAGSIKKQGLLQPLVVRQINDKQYEIIAGERRWRACQLAGLTEVPVVIRHVDDETAMAMALVENLQREDLNAMDQARAMHRLTTEFALTHQQVAELLSKSRTAVSNYLRLLNLNANVRRMLEYGDLDMGHARALLVLDENQQSEVAELIVAQNLSVRETEKLVTRVKSGKVNKTESKQQTPPLFQEQLAHLEQSLNMKMKIKPGKAGKGSLIIHYNDMHNLQFLLEQLSTESEETTS